LKINVDTTLLAAARQIAPVIRAHNDEAELMYSIAGTNGIYTKNPLERHFRDLQVLKQHGFGSENRFEAVGQVYLGLPPEFAPVVL
jgi:hypothetical protein